MLLCWHCSARQLLRIHAEIQLLTGLKGDLYEHGSGTL